MTAKSVNTLLADAQEFAMPKLTSSVPRYCHHRPSGKAFVRLNGKQIYLGPWKSKASKLEYDRLIGEWLAEGRRLPGSASGRDLTVVELCAKYWAFAKRYYTKNGKPTGAQDGIKILPGHNPFRTFPQKVSLE